MGHVLPNLAVIEELTKLVALKDKHLQIIYIGSATGPERVVAKANNLKFRPILCGKLRRYFSFHNFIDFLKIPIGVAQSFIYLLLQRPAVVFSKGGFVSFPVCVAAWMLRIPLILHESDLSPGLANKLCARFAGKMCLSFEESKKFFPNKNCEITGNPVRKMILNGDKKIGFKITHLSNDKPVILVMGGSQGATQINELIWGNLPELLKTFSIIHITGEGHKKAGLKQKGYLQIEYAHEDLPHLYAMANYVVTRGGANSLWEITALGLPALVIPLMHGNSRGDQVENARLFAQKFGFLHLEGKFSNKDFLEAVKNLTTVKIKQVSLQREASLNVAKIIFSFLK